MTPHEREERRRRDLQDLHRLLPAKTKQISSLICLIKWLWLLATAHLLWQHQTREFPISIPVYGLTFAEGGVARSRFLLIPALTTACGDDGGYWDLTVIVADFSTAQECVYVYVSTLADKGRERGRGRATHNLAGFSLKTSHALCCVCGFDCCTCLSLRLCGRIRLLPHSINCVCV